MKRQFKIGEFKIGDRVRRIYSDGSFDDGTITGCKREDSYYPVRFHDDKTYLFRVQLVKPSHLKLLPANKSGRIKGGYS